jgi:hypothetical protein
MSSQSKKTGMITRTSILILCAALLGAACFGLGPAGMRVYLLLAGVMGLIAFFGLDYISRKSGQGAATGGKVIGERMQQHQSRPAEKKEEKAKTA